jgi:hypothetical protein
MVWTNDGAAGNIRWSPWERVRNKLRGHPFDVYQMNIWLHRSHDDEEVAGVGTAPRDRCNSIPATEYIKGCWLTFTRQRVMDEEWRLLVRLHLTRNLNPAPSPPVLTPSVCFYIDSSPLEAFFELMPAASTPSFRRASPCKVIAQFFFLQIWPYCMTGRTLRVRTRSMHCLMRQNWEHQHWRMIIRRRQRMSIWNANFDRFGHPPLERVLQGRGRGLA